MMKRFLLGSLCLLAAPALADELVPFKGPIRHMYYKVATGEVYEITGSSPRIGTTIAWDSSLATGFFTNRVSTQLVLDWGDIESARLGTDGIGTDQMNGFDYGFATNGLVEPTINITFYTEENGANSVGRVPIATGDFTVPGTVSPDGVTIAGWIVTVDLEGGFEVPITGTDLDADGKVDFGYSYWMVDRAGATQCGPIIAISQPEALPDQPGAPGAVDAFDRFSSPTAAFDPGNGDLQTFDGTFFFGGNPFAQFYMTIFSNATLVATGGCCLPSNCITTSAADCATQGGTYLGDAQPCTDPGSQLAQGSSSPNAPIEDGLAGGGDGTTLTDSITLSGGFTIGNVEVDVNIPDHTFIGDLRIELVNGSDVVVLWGTQCGGNDGLTVTFSDNGPAPVCASPTSGTVRSFQSMAGAFGNRTPSANGGVWTLQVTDTFAADIGTLASWSIRLRDAESNCGAACPCAGDFDNSNDVGLGDLSALLSSFGGAPSNPCMDTDGDNLVGLADLSAFLSRFGSTCP